MQISGSGSVSSVRQKSAETAPMETTKPSSGAPTDRFASSVQKKQLDVPLLYQYTGSDQNACGTTSLAMIMQFLGKKVSRQEIDQKIRPVDGPTAPDDVVEYARAQGFNAEMYNKGSVEEIKKFLDRGIPVQALIDPDVGSDTTLHYVVVTGYETDPKTGKTNLLINNPARLEPQRMDEDEFNQRWGDLNVLGVGTGVDRFFMAIAPKSEELPPSRRDGARFSLGVFEAIGVGEKVVDTASDAWSSVKSTASSAWNKVKGWFS